ncbi:hypothetical protein HNV11_05380 [Spirosoma taeanense]|uniref:Uncharacterized protein n=1 Tax=Spirosoma taeanense TaxID=2735870 RepID=A0A6M5Y6Z9_9BACT|nr:hypothetical protein [Spirosoma taeanense]QJW88853.1 hypothetical protein HNV11_05380 [Spirosoma taeanense]
MPVIHTSAFISIPRLIILTWLVATGSGLAQPRALKSVLTARQAAFVPKNPPIAAFNGLQTIQNERVKVGVDSRYGGAITYLSFIDGPNMVNNVDLGRQIQIGLYSGPNPYTETGKQPDPGWYGLGWNPIQAGDLYGNASNVLAFEKQDNLLYVKTQPRHFPLNDVLGESFIEQWIRLENNVVKVHAKVTFFRSDKVQYEARQQEMPCVYLNGPYHNLYAYTGGSPYTYDGLTQLRPPIPFGDIFPTEPWMAATDDSGFGVGLFAANNYDWKKGYFGSDLAGDELSNDASYIASTNYVVLDHNVNHEWDYELVVGHLNEIRSYMYAKPRPLAGPNYRFDTSRQGWHYFNATDSGWPIQGNLTVELKNKQRDMIQSPAFFWKGSNNRKLFLRAAFKTQHDKFRFSWRKSEDMTMYRHDDRYLDFAIINDGQFHTYEIDLSQKAGWIDSNIGQVEFRPLPNGPDINGWVKIEWLATRMEGPDTEAIQPPLDIPPVSALPAKPTEMSCTACVELKLQQTRFARGPRSTTQQGR